MTFWQVLLAVLVVFWLISLIRIGGRVCYGQAGVSASALVGPFRIQLLPAKPKKPKKPGKPQKEKPAVAEKHKKEFVYLVKKLRRNSPQKTGRDQGNETGAAAKNEEEYRTQGESCGYPLAPASAETAEKAECEWQNIKISLNIPEGWKYETEEYSEYAGRFGIRFAPEGCDGWVGLYYYGMFGVCGTGLEEKEITFEDGRKARMGIYDGGDTFSFITFQEQELSSGNFVALAEDGGDWLAEQEEEVLKILGAAVLEEAY